MNDKIKQLLENAEQSDAIAKNKWRIENREQLREQRKKELKELMEKDKTMSNNKQIMKLYTERQMKEMFRMGLAHSINENGALAQFAPIELPSDSLCINCDDSKSTHNICMDCIIKIGKENIELPSDEEINEESPYVPNDASLDFWAHKEGFVDGAKWMRDKIQGGNK